MFIEFTAAGRWFIRNDRGQIITKQYESYDDLIADKF